MPTWLLDYMSLQSLHLFGHGVEVFSVILLPRGLHSPNPALRIPPLGLVRIPYRGRVFEFLSNKICFVCKGFGVLQCDPESSAEEVDCSGGVTY